MLDKSQSPLAYQELAKLLAKLKENLNNQSNYPQPMPLIDQILTLLLNFPQEEKISLITETHRELRLLKTDLILLSGLKDKNKQTAKKETIDKRLARITSFIELLI